MTGRSVTRSERITLLAREIPTGSDSGQNSYLETFGKSAHLSRITTALKPETRVLCSLRIATALDNVFESHSYSRRLPALV